MISIYKMLDILSSLFKMLYALIWNNLLICILYACPRSNLAILANLDINLSRRYRIKNREILDTAIGVAPAYHTRIRDDLAVRPSQRDFTNAYSILRLPTITSKTRETAFQILNRTIWTNNKAFKSRLRPDPYCERCKKVETMEHLLCECEYYSEPLWNKLAEGLTMLLNDISTDRVPRIELGQTNIIFNIPHPSIILHLHDKSSRNAILLLVQEVKRDLIYRRMNLPPSAQQITDPRRLAAHLDSTIRRLALTYNTSDWWGTKNPQTCYCGYKNITLPGDSEPITMLAYFFSTLMTKNTFPMPTLSHVHTPHT